MSLFIMFTIINKSIHLYFFFLSIFYSPILSSIFYGVGTHLSSFDPSLLFSFGFLFLPFFGLLFLLLLLLESPLSDFTTECAHLIKSCLCLSSNLEFPYVLHYHYPVTDKSKFIIPGNLAFPYMYLFLGLHNQQAIKTKSRIFCGVGFPLLNSGDCYFYHYKFLYTYQFL